MRGSSSRELKIKSSTIREVTRRAAKKTSAMVRAGDFMGSVRDSRLGLLRRGSLPQSKHSAELNLLHQFIPVSLSFQK
jgi:hypothetical protein